MLTRAPDTLDRRLQKQRLCWAQQTPRFQRTSSSGSLTSTHRFFFSSHTICHDWEEQGTGQQVKLNRIGVMTCDPSSTRTHVWARSEAGTHGVHQR